MVIKERKSSRSAVASLLLMNLVPIWGVFFRDWDIGEILIIYWVENVAIGVVNFLKMATNRHSDIFPGLGIFPGVFFCWHYSFFCAGHGALIFSFFKKQKGGFGGNEIALITDKIAQYPWLFVGFLSSHLVSFVSEYHLKGEAKRLTLTTLMFLPYLRIMTLHLAILIGAFASQAMGGFKWMIVILVIFKIAGDLFLHIREFRTGKSFQV